MNIDQQIYYTLLDNAGGKQSEIKGINKMMLSKMKRGDSKTKFSQLLEALLDNGIEQISLKSKHTLMNIDVKGKDIHITTKRVAEK